MTYFSPLRSSTQALSRLIELQRRGRHLFHADRRNDPPSELYPSVIQTQLDPQQTRGYWAPKIGLLLRPPMVRDVFASALAAVMMAVTQARDGSRCFHVDQFSDGIAAVTFGEFIFNRGVYRELIEQALEMRCDAPMPDHFINVLPRSTFPEALNGSLLVGIFVSSDPVRIQERVQLTAGDVLAAAELLGAEIPWIDSDAARSDPFTGPFRQGGQLQFHALSGQQRLLLRHPTDADRKEALAHAEARRFDWLSSERASLQIAEPSHGRPSSGPLGRALKLIEEHCTRALTVPEMAAAAGMSTSHFHALFRKAMGCPPLEYAMGRRLDIAEQLLTGTQLTVAEVAGRCGFSEQASLTRSLRRRRGVTPAFLRRTANLPVPIQ